MQTRYLPALKKLSIKNYSLYSGDLNFSYNFVDGINLIIGGNGVGKTTFLNIIKYALIGLYKKEIDVKRREYKGVEYRYDKRINLPYSYFRNRMDPSAQYNQTAEVTLTFVINKTEFEITRDLYEPKVKQVKIKESGRITFLKGKVVSQFEFDGLIQSKKSEAELENTLQWKYEEKVGKVSNHEFFDNIIFLVNDVLFFNESRKTIMWDSAVQGKLSSKYFIDPLLDEQKEKEERNGKYYDSLARHKSEDIRAINKIFETVDNNDSLSKTFKKLISEIESEKKIIANYLKDLDKTQKDRNTSEIKINTLHSDKNLLHKKLEETEATKRIEEQKIFTNLFKKVTPKYYDYLKSLKVSHDCPLCNNELPSKIFERVTSDETHCMMCSNQIVKPQISSLTHSKIKIQIDEILKKIRSKEKEIIAEEEHLKKLDEHFRDTTIDLNNSQSKLRKAEFAIQTANGKKSSTTNNEFKAMKARIDELEREKEQAQNKSRKAYSKATEILEKIDKQRLASREKLSGIFNSFGSKFLAVKCELVYEDPKDDEGKRYLPKINSVTRYQEEELSESQRFFIDQSFRMSLINFFNSASSFFMCETPDSSLDISYEQNAAKIFLEYVKRPNALILTSNLNNSEFLEYLIGTAKSINYVNLLKIGKQSVIQSGSTQLSKASTKIEKFINAKKGRR